MTMSPPHVLLEFQMITVCSLFSSTVGWVMNDFILGGEVPMAFVVLTADAARRAERDPRVAEGIKESIVKVGLVF